MSMNMKAALIGLLLALASPLVAFAQCSGQAGANTYCGNNTGSTALPGWKPASTILPSAALTKADDTNVTLTLTGTPATALLQAVQVTAGWTGTLAAARLNSNVVQGVTNDTNVTGSILAQNMTLGWTGQLGLTRGGTNASLTASNGGIFYSTATAGAILSGTATANQLLMSGSSAAPSWSTATYPATAAAGTILAAGSSNTITATATPTLGANGGTGGQVTLAGSTSGTAAIRVAAAAGTGTIFQIPATNGSNTNLLQTDGAGVTSWVAGGSGTVTSITQGGLTTLSTNPCVGTCTIGTNATIGPQGRLTLTSGTPVLTSSVTAATTVYYALYLGNLVPIYNGTNMVPTVFAELSIALGSNWTTATNYDVYVGSDAGTTRLCTGAAWTNSTTRSEALSRATGLYLNNASMTCRYNNTTTFTCAASRCTYVGTFRTTAAGQVDFIFGASSAGGTAANLMLWNYYNRVMVGTKVTATASTTYTSATVRQFAGATNMQVSFISGDSEDSIFASVGSEVVTVASGGANLSIGIAIDSTTTYACQRARLTAPTALALAGGISTPCVMSPVSGLHIVSFNQSSDGANANEFNNSAAANLVFQFRM